MKEKTMKTPPSRFIVMGSPRCGTTYLMNLLACHPQIDQMEEPLNSEQRIEKNPIEHIEKMFQQFSKKPMIGFKCFVEQLHERDIRADVLIRSLKCNIAVIIWRKNFLEMFVSRKIATSTGIWYSEEKPVKVEKIEVDEKEFLQFAQWQINEWKRTAFEWPIEVSPLFISYEDFVSNPKQVAAQIFTALNVAKVENFVLGVKMQRQNPASLQEKVVNFHLLSEKIKEFSIDIPQIFNQALIDSLPVDNELKNFLPDREPPIPSGGWSYRIAEPYLPIEAKQNVLNALGGRSVSSASYWPKHFSAQLQHLFKVPVAQPCCNGFTALMLALQMARVGPDDEVIVPAMTMIAVPNSIHYVGGQVVLADNAPNSYNPELEQILKVATSKTKAVIVTHTYGVPVASIDRLMQECSQRGWALIEDIAECVGIRHQPTGHYLGTFGDFACASLYANKIVHGGDGGFILAKHAHDESRLQSLVNHGFTKSFHFLHLEPTINAKINGIGAALASGVFVNLPKIMKHRSQMAALYRRHLQSTPLELMPECGLTDTPWVFGCRCQTKVERTELRAFLAKNGIETRDYFLPLHIQPAIQRKQGQEGKRYPEAEQLGSTGFYFPMFTDLNENDVKYICQVVQEFYGLGRTDPKPKRPQWVDIQAAPEQYKLQIVEYDNGGCPVDYVIRDHYLLRAVHYNYQFDQYLIKEKWDLRHVLCNDILECIHEADEFEKPKLEAQFHPILKYLNHEPEWEPPVFRPWLSPEYDDKRVHFIETTSEKETLHLLVWLIEQYRAQNILEIGSWMGYASALMARAAKRVSQTHLNGDKKPSIYCLDGFTWQYWMTSFAPQAKFPIEGSFLDVFKQNMRLADVEDVVHPIRWYIEDSEFPDVLHHQKFDLVFIDCTQEDYEFEIIWKAMVKHCVPGKTLLVYNGMVRSSIQFFNNHQQDLKSLYKPNGLAKVFLYQPKVTEQAVQPFNYEQPMLMLNRKLNFADSPDWQHHHQNAFLSSIEHLKTLYHDPEAEVLFLPAVEDYICNHMEEGICKPWIGIIHHIVDDKQLFYYPDLDRLCHQDTFKVFLDNCLGLFTLTEFQAEYLTKHLPVKIPICPLTYPSSAGSSKASSIADRFWRQNSKIELTFVGSFARDIDFFYRAIVPLHVQKVLLASDEITCDWAAKAPPTVCISPRLSEDEYERMLQTSIPFLALTKTGAANTLIVECVHRNAPILAPRLSSCVEYLGAEYPLLYEPRCDDFSQLLTVDNVSKAIDYLKNRLDKTKFTIEHFCDVFGTSAVLWTVPPCKTVGDVLHLTDARCFDHYDLTICICSYKRTHHLASILRSLYQEQTFQGQFEIIVWNNNINRSDVVHRICQPYLEVSGAKGVKGRHRLELIESSDNHYCIIRTAIASLMRSDRLLICDDDVEPTPHFINFFHQASLQYPEDVLCVRGHTFLPHMLNTRNPERFWLDYEHLRFVDDRAPPQEVHFVHADACLFPIEALKEWASVPLPDPSIVLVDDYFMSYVLNDRFGRKLRKLQCRDDQLPLLRMDDSDKPGLALHTRPEVIDARIRLYVYHMVRGWPKWQLKKYDTLTEDQRQVLHRQKHHLWQQSHYDFGYNVSSKISTADIEDLVRLGVRHVRIGAVGVRKDRHFEFSEFAKHPQRQIKKLLNVIDALAEKKITVVITLDRRLTSEETWSLIASECVVRGNVIGYDLINEPATELNEDSHWTEMMQPDVESVAELACMFKSITAAIELEDPLTPIILEPPFWGHIGALEHLNPLISTLDLKVKSRLVVSVHFYEPSVYTRRHLNKNRFKFPCQVPVFTTSESETYQLDEAWIGAKFTEAAKWSRMHSVPVFVGEAGVARNIPGGELYLRAIFNQCRSNNLPVYAFSYRDLEWEAMDYEFGAEMASIVHHRVNNPLMDAIEEAIRNAL